MANATVSRLGLKNATGTNFDELFLKVFSGEVLTAFGQNNIFLPETFVLLHALVGLTLGEF